MMESAINPRASGLTWSALLLTALSLSIGWGIRGNFGHEYGAMIPGALAAMAICLMSGREDWRRRVACFAFFGALGWSFGGSISYMQVIAYTHSGVASSVVYGFACLFVIGFLWAAMGGAGTALPACLERERLTEFFAPLIAVFAAWTLQDVVAGLLVHVSAARRHESWLYWYDTDWIAAMLAIVAVLLLAAARGRLCAASRLILHMAVGWWAGFLLLVVVLGLRMTPPRGDNWAGALGMTVGMLVYLLRHNLAAVAYASILSGLIGGFGFAMATCLKLIELSVLAVGHGLATNWHSVLEQTYGFINGIGIAVAMGVLMRRTPPVADAPRTRRWTEAFAVFFVLVAITYVNLVKNPEEWTKPGRMAAVMYGLSTRTWFNIGYLLVAVAAAWLLAHHLHRPLALVPATWLGKGQLLYLVFLWWMVLGNFERALPAFQPERLITEGVILVNAVICTLLVLLCPTPSPSVAGPVAPTEDARGWTWRLSRLALIGLAAMILTVGAQTGIVRALYGDTRAPDAGRHIRFGPQATAKGNPVPGQDHP